MWGVGVSPARAPLGAGTATFLPKASCGQAQPGPARKGNICLFFGGPGVPPAASPLPPPLFIAFHQHLEFEPIQRWLTPSWGMELGEMCAAGEGGSPRALPSSVRGLQHPGVDLRTTQGLGNPRSILALLSPAVGTVGELPHLPLTVMLAHGPVFWLGLEAPLTFAISRQPHHPHPESVTEVPLAWGDAELQ